MEKDEMRELFGRASNLKGSDQSYSPEDLASHKRVKSGMKNFKRKAIGRWASKSTKTEGQLVHLLVDTGIAETYSEGEKIVGALDDKETLTNGGRYLSIERVSPRIIDRLPEYRISTGSLD